MKLQNCDVMLNFQVDTLKEYLEQVHLHRLSVLEITNDIQHGTH